MSTLLTAQAVRDLTRACACAPGESPSIMVEGIHARFGFVRSKVQAQRPAIDWLLGQLPMEFRVQHLGGGGGWSFLNACVDSSGRHWGEHPDVELLLALGLATGGVELLLERDLWGALPGGMPYFQVLLLHDASFYDAR